MQEEDRILRDLGEDLEKDPRTTGQEVIEIITGGGKVMMDVTQDKTLRMIRRTHRMKALRMRILEGGEGLKGEYTWYKVLKDHRVRMGKMERITFPRLVKLVVPGQVTQGWLQP